MVNEKENCPICNSKCKKEFDNSHDSCFFECPVCGRFEFMFFKTGGISELQYNKLGPYLLYHKFEINNPDELRYNTMLDIDSCKKACESFRNGKNINGLPKHFDKEIIDIWYPNSFNEKINTILLYLYKLTKHMGEKIIFQNEALPSLLFVDRFEINIFDGIEKESSERRQDHELLSNEEYVLKYLKKCEYIDYYYGAMPADSKETEITLQPKGYQRVDELTKTDSQSKDVFIAMKFDENTNKLREAIKSGITKAGYLPIIMDEVQHNNNITVEMLKKIRDSRFLVVDLSYPCDGAYFEEGYAMGLGKTVIQLCDDSHKLHFDVAQKNTIIWKDFEELTIKLKERIEATIE